MKRFWVVAFFIAGMPCWAVSQYAHLTAQDPRGWQSGHGTIEAAVLELTPVGMFAQADLYLTFSARDLGFGPNDSLEIHYDFDLPTGSIVNDLWLWINDTLISKAIILDRWTASTIYENIVRRRRDPALLVEQWWSYNTESQHYELKIYPLRGQGQRKVKMSFMLPVEWGVGAVSVSLPVHMLRATKNAVGSFPLFFHSQGNWLSPAIAEMPSLVFTPNQNTSCGPACRCDIPGTLYQDSDSRVTLQFRPRIRTDVFLSRYGQQESGIFQLVLTPYKILSEGEARKVVFLFDYDSAKTSFTPDALLSGLKSHLSAEYSQADSFNLYFTHGSIVAAGNHWYGGDSADVAQAFGNAGPMPIWNATDLSNLLSEGIQFIVDHGGVGSLCLISASDKLGDYTVANPIIQELTGMLPAGVPIFVVDVLNRNWNYYYNGEYFIGNEYFFQNLAKKTGGAAWSVREVPYATMLSQASGEALGRIEAFDMHTRLADGFCYGRFNSWNAAGSLPAAAPLSQVGKYLGTFPFVVEMAGIYRGVPVQKTVMIQESEVTECDTLAEEVWAGRFIQSLESGDGSNATTTEIVQASLEARVLSRYTAFLALEPNDSVVTTPTQEQPPVVGSAEKAEEVVPEQGLVEAYPNPFNAQTTIRVRLPKGVAALDVTLRIFNPLGQVVRTFPVDALSGQQPYVLSWDGRDDAGQTVASGVYFFVLTSPQGVLTTKLVLIK